jgi:saccharopine dehydrogenase-like NADP-dependent oxidoreductase
MTKTVLILGLGMQGKAVLHDLMTTEGVGKILIADNNPELTTLLSPYDNDKVEGFTLDLENDEACLTLMKRADIVVETLPAPFTLPIAELAIKAGVHLVNCSYLLTPTLTGAAKTKAEALIDSLNAKAQDKGVILMSEFGLDPGIDLTMAKMALDQLDSVEELHMFGSGLPYDEAANNPLGYKFSWSIMGVMKAYKRPAQMISGGKVKTINADQIFEANNVKTLPATPERAEFEYYPNGNAVHYAEKFGLDGITEMGRYTCRLPGHAKFWEKMVKCGFLDHATIMVQGHEVEPIEFVAALLGSQDQFNYRDDERDLAYLRLEAKGTKSGQPRHLFYEMLDKRDMSTGLTAMQRSVGFMMTSAVKLILSGKVSAAGLYNPMDIAPDDILPLLAAHGINIVAVNR